MVAHERAIVRQSQPESSTTAPERVTSLQPTYEDTVEPDPLFDWELERDNEE